MAVERGGWTLIELVIVIALFAVLSQIYVAEFGNNVDALRYEETRHRLETLKKAMVGIRSLDNEGRRTQFGYFGDMGRLPASVTELFTIGSQTAWTYNTSDGFGAGWRGPYIEPGVTGSIDLTKDAWGKTVYLDTSLPAVIRSWGADNASGGTSYDTDLLLQIPSDELFSTVSGYVSDRDTRLSSKDVRIRYPVNGATTSPADATTTSEGYFSFSGVPFGVRSVQVITSPGIGPVQITVSKNKFQVPNVLLSYTGQTRAVSFTSGTKKQGSSVNVIQATLANTYRRDLVLSTVNVTWDASPANLIRLGVNGFSQTVSITTGGTITVTAKLILFAKKDNILEFEFDGDAQSESPVVVFTYKHETKTDSVTIS